jgi:hypothetical protein
MLSASRKKPDSALASAWFASAHALSSLISPPPRTRLLVQELAHCTLRGGQKPLTSGKRPYLYEEINDSGRAVVWTDGIPIAWHMGFRITALKPSPHQPFSPYLVVRFTCDLE